MVTDLVSSAKKSLEFNWENQPIETFVSKHFEDWFKLIKEHNKDFERLKVGNNYIITRALLKNIVYKNNYYHVADKDFRSRRLARVYIKNHLNYFIQNIEFTPNTPVQEVSVTFTVDYSDQFIKLT